MRILLVFLFWTGLVGMLPAVCRAGTAGVPVETERINAEIEQAWQDYDLQPSPPASDGEWCRRVYLDVLGRIPRLAELRAFTQNRRGDKRRELVKELLYHEKYMPEYARNWTTIWTNLLIGRNGGNERNSLTNRAGMQKHLRDVFASNQSYDQLVRDLVTAEGESSPGTENFNGAVNFLSDKLGEKGSQATAETARLFLGKQVQCTQCHNHPFNEWKQNQFWELNSFFRQTVSLRRFDQASRMVSYVELTDQDFGGEGSTPEEAAIFYELRNATLESAYPVFINGEPLGNRSGFVEDINRRHELGRFILASKEMPRAIVNRMWGHFFGYGFTTPVDDMGPHNAPTHPALLSYLAEQFSKQSYDLKLLIEWLVLSEPYALSSQMTKDNRSDDPTLGERPMFSHFYIRQMQAEELYESLLIATGADALASSSETREKNRNDWLQQFVVAFGTDDGGEGTTFDGTVTQTLMLFNGPLMKEALSASPGGMLSKLAQSNIPFQRKINFLFESAVARQATKQEEMVAGQLIQWREGKVIEGLQDLWWAILNSNEFILNH